MDKHSIVQDRPREKLKRQGIMQLTDRELVQLLISSGSGKHSVGRIATKVLSAIKSLNAELSYDKLEQIAGLGPARISQLLAAFELAARYPVRRRTIRLHSAGAVNEFIASEVSLQKHSILTIDGAGYLISKREYALDVDGNVTELLRHVVGDVGMDNANRVIVILHSRKRTVAPLMTGLMVARDLRQLGRFLGFSVTDVIVEQNGNHHSTLERQRSA